MCIRVDSGSIPVGPMLILKSSQSVVVDAKWWFVFLHPFFLNSHCTIIVISACLPSAAEDLPFPDIVFLVRPYPFCSLLLYSGLSNNVLSVLATLKKILIDNDWHWHSSTRSWPRVFRKIIRAQYWLKICGSLDATKRNVQSNFYRVCNSFQAAEFSL